MFNSSSLNSLMTCRMVRHHGTTTSHLWDTKWPHFHTISNCGNFTSVSLPQQRLWTSFVPGNVSSHLQPVVGQQPLCCSLPSKAHHHVIYTIPFIPNQTHLDLLLLAKSWHASIIRLACIWSSVVSLANQKNCASTSLTLQHHGLVGFLQETLHLFSTRCLLSLRLFASSPLPLPLPLPLAALALLP